MFDARFRTDRANHFSGRSTMFGTTYANYWTWQKLFSYGEVVCFVSAWAVGVLIALEGQQAKNDRPAAPTFASASDSLGIQANLAR